MLKYEPIIKLANMLNYTAFVLGNHDFDDGTEGLQPFLDRVNFPVLAANVNASKIPDFQAKIIPSYTIDMNGTKIGIIGYITPKTAKISSKPVPKVEFLDEIYSVKSECAKLKRQGVEILIGLGHSGYKFDQVLAKEVDDIDVVVGGHSHSYLYTGDNPTDHPEGNYPTYVRQRSGKVVPVVQAGSYSKYVGFMKLNFDKHGNLNEPVNGQGVEFAQPYLLDEKVPKDQETLEAMAPFEKQLAKYKEVIGYSEVFLDRNGKEECLVGDFVANAFKEFGWQNIDISFVNTGGLRNQLSIGNITLEDMYQILPFNNTLDKITIKGKDIKKVLQSKLKAGKSLLQISGGQTGKFELLQNKFA